VESRSRGRRRRPWTTGRASLRALAIALPFAAGIFLGEGFVRAFELAPERRPTLTGGVVHQSADPELGSENLPGAELVARFQNCGGGLPREVVHRINARGWRGREAAPEPRPAGVRIACVGDSLMFGLYVEEEETFPPLLERAFASAAPELDVEALNFSVIGMADPEKVRLIQTALPAYRPDLALMQVYGGEGGHKAMARLQASNWITRWLRPDAGGWFGALRERSLVVELVAASLFARAFEDNWIAANRRAAVRGGAYWGSLSESVLRARDSAEAIGAEFLLVCFPILQRTEKGLLTAELGRRLAGFAADHGIAYLDLHAAFEGSVLEPLRVHPTDNHYSGEAHGIAAAAVAEYLLAEGLPRAVRVARGGE
jgi:hypothetical protein